VKQYQTEAIVLRASAVREADRTLVLLTRDRGKLRVWAHGAARPTSRKRGAVQPFCRSRFLLERGREIDVVRQAEALEEFPALHADLEALALAGYVCELAEGFAAEGQAEPGIYGLLLQVLRRLAEDKSGLPVRFFEARILALTGFGPELGSCAGCGAQPVVPARFSPALGGVLCRGCRDRDPPARPCRSAVVQVLGKLLEWPLDRLKVLRIDAATGREVADILQACVCHHLEREPRSLAFLRKMGISSS